MNITKFLQEKSWEDLEYELQEMDAFPKQSVRKEISL